MVDDVVINNSENEKNGGESSVGRDPKRIRSEHNNLIMGAIVTNAANNVEARTMDMKVEEVLSS